MEALPQKKLRRRNRIIVAVICLTPAKQQEKLTRENQKHIIFKMYLEKL